MNDQLYELTVEKNHLSIIIKALSNYICSQYDMLDAEVVDVPKTTENIKIASDMQFVLKHHLGGVQHSPKQTAETTGLVWIKDVKLDIMSEPQLSINGEQWERVGEEGQEYLKNLIQTLRDKHKEDLLDPIKWEESRKRYLERKRGSKLKFDLLGDLPEPFEPFNDENLQYTNEVLQQAWNNVKERHWDTIKRIGEK